MKSRPNFKILDCLRGIAALYVVINHCRGNLFIGGSEMVSIIPVQDWSIWTKLHYALLRFTSLGSEFVVVFFVLSGFSIAYSLRNQQKILKFYLKRLVRLYPPFILALLWASFVYYIISIYEPTFNKGLKSVFDTPQSTLLNLIYLSNGAYISQFWSLVHEVIFYLIAPFVILKRNYYYLMSLLLYLYGWIVGWDQLTGTTIITKFLFDYNFYFVIGIWLFNNYDFVKRKIQVNKIKTLGFSILIITLMVVIKYITSDYNKITPLLAAILSLFWIINFQKNKISSNWLFFVGTMSYTLYISHFASIKIYHMLLIKLKFVSIDEKITNPIVWILGILFCLAISYVFYIVAEKPTKIILQKLRK